MISPLKLRLVFISSLLVLGVLLLFTVFRPMTAQGNYSQIFREELLETDDQYIVEFHIINHEGEDKEYTIITTIGNQSYQEDVLVLDGRTFTYIYHLYRNRITADNVTFTIYKEGHSAPVEKTTYHLR